MLAAEVYSNECDPNHDSGIHSEANELSFTEVSRNVPRLECKVRTDTEKSAGIRQRKQKSLSGSVAHDNHPAKIGVHEYGIWSFHGEENETAGTLDSNRDADADQLVFQRGEMRA